MADFIQRYWRTLNWWQRLKYRWAPLGDVRLYNDAAKWANSETSDSAPGENDG